MGTANKEEMGHLVGLGTAVWPAGGPCGDGGYVLGISVEGKFWRVGLWGQPGRSGLGEDKGSSGMSILGLRYKVAGQNYVEEK